MIIDTALAKVFGTKHDRDVKAIQPIVFAVAEWEPKLVGLSDDALRGKTADFKNRLHNALEERRGETDVLDELLPEAFAVVREASKRALGDRKSTRLNSSHTDISRMPSSA